MAEVSKTIIDLEPCLVKIAEYLTMTDILNVADAFNITDENVTKLENEISTENSQNDRFVQFAKAIQQIYLKKNGSRIDIDNSSHVPFYSKMLTHFGGLVSDLTVQYDCIPDQMQIAVDGLILKNCCESLKKITLVNVNEGSLVGIQCPFSSVTSVRIYEGYLDKRLSKFHRWFPKMKKLILRGVHFATPECVEHHFQHLTHLDISNDDDDDSMAVNSKITDSNVKIALQLNPQIKTLDLCDDAGGRDDFGICLNQKSLFFVQRKLKEISDLTLNISHLNYEPVHRQGQINFEFLTSLTLSIKKCSYLKKIMIKASQLVELTLESEEELESDMDMHRMYEMIGGFTKEMQNINYLFIKTMHRDYDLYGKYMSDLVNSLGNLEEFSIVHDWQGVMAADAIIHFLTNCKQIMTFTIQDDYNQSSALLPDFEIERTFRDSFKSCAEINMFDTTIWDITFGYNEVPFVSISKLN